MPTLLVSLDTFSPDVQDLVKLYDEANHVDVQAYGDPRSTRRPFSTLRSILINGVRYSDKGAACACSALRLFKFGEEAFTLCAAHGLQSIGFLRREIVAPPAPRRKPAGGSQ